MIVRIVKMQFIPEKTDAFLAILHENIEKIRSFPGCLSVQVLRDLKDPSVFITYSHWEDETDLEAYRQSELFRGVWTRTKALFAKKAQAWSLEDIDDLISAP